MLRAPTPPTTIIHRVLTRVSTFITEHINTQCNTGAIDCETMPIQDSTRDASAPAPTQSHAKVTTSHQLFTCTIKAPQFSYAHLEVLTDGNVETPADLDNLQVLFLCRAALQRFLGTTGLAIPIDILKIKGNHCWLRVPRPDLGAFAAAITAYSGRVEDGTHHVIRLRQCSDWLGAMVGSDGQAELWAS
jgi:ribonuclease P/MRP protein subunit POP8